MAKCANVNAENYKMISVDIEGADQDEIMDNFTIEQFVNKFSVYEILDFIGLDECKRHFDLVDFELNATKID